MDKKFDIEQIREAYEYLMKLEVDPINNKLWECLHQVIWHYGIDRVRWILENKDLVEEIAKYDLTSQISDELSSRYMKSIEYYKKLNR